MTNNCGTAYSDVIRIIVVKRPLFSGDDTYLSHRIPWYVKGVT
ncbi:MAG: hypothetical protein ACLU30_09655 [Odoribacter splanchnicus]